MSLDNQEFVIFKATTSLDSSAHDVDEKPSKEKKKELSLN